MKIKWLKVFLVPALCLSFLVFENAQAESEDFGKDHDVIVVAESRAHITGEQAVAAENLRVLVPEKEIYTIGLDQILFFRSNYDVAWLTGGTGTISGQLKLYVDGVLVDKTPLEKYTFTTTGPHREPSYPGAPSYQDFKVAHLFSEYGIHKVEVEIVFTAKSSEQYAEDRDSFRFIVNVVPIFK